MIFSVVTKCLRIVWPFLPIRPRQALARWVLHRLQPANKIDPNRASPQKDVPRIIVGMLSSNYSFGKAARMFAELTKSAGTPVYGINLAKLFPDQDTGHPVLLKTPPNSVLDGPHHLILVLNGSLLKYAVYCLGGAYRSHAFVSAYWAWETPCLPTSWMPAFDLVHEIVVGSSFVKEAILKTNPKAVVRIAPHPVAIFPPPSVDTKSMRDGPLVVLHASNLASGAERKNPLGAAEIFCKAFEPDSGPVLRMHLNNLQVASGVYSRLEKLIAGRGDVFITTGVKSEKDYSDWWLGGHVFLSAHRAEGFGLGLAEAMVSGYCAMGTGWSGNMEFMNEHNSVCIPYDLVKYDAKTGQYVGEYVWAEPNIEQAAVQLSNLNADRGRLISLASCGKEQVCEATKPRLSLQALYLSN